MTEGIILAGGCSSRAKTNKLLFSFEGKPLIIHAIEGMRAFVDHLYVVTGFYHDELKDAIKNIEGITIIHNPDYSKGMFSSVLAGIKNVQNDCFILPSDCPLVTKNTYSLLLTGSKNIRFPTYKGHDGHPIFISKVLINKLKKEPLESNLRLFRDRHDIERISTDDKYVLTDIDTLEDYENLINERN